MNRKNQKCWRIFVIYVIGWMMLMSLNACTTGLNGDFCDIYLPVFPDYEKDTPETIRQIDKNNIVYQECL